MVSERDALLWVGRSLGREDWPWATVERDGNCAPGLLQLVQSCLLSADLALEAQMDDVSW